MDYCYAVSPTRSHVLLLENRMKMNGIIYELTYLPRDIMSDMCTMGIKYPAYETERVNALFWGMRLSGYRFYREVAGEQGKSYEVIG